ncbi:hypothetical protein JHK85_022793 [Glycine max]|nr:hypothetical protein JHK85_022793 [Glycine max]KAG5026415.1 hypothetical protein JHK86_022329 [Glycine max]
MLDKRVANLFCATWSYVLFGKYGMMFMVVNSETKDSNVKLLMEESLVDNKVNFYIVSFVKDAEVVHKLKNYLKSCGADIHVIVKIESVDSIPNLPSIIAASDRAMVARGDVGIELPIEEVPPLETAYEKFPLKVVQVRHIVALQTKATIPSGKMPPNIGQVLKNHMSEMFAYHATMMSNTLGTSIIVSTGTGFMTQVGLNLVLSWQLDNNYHLEDKMFFNGIRDVRKGIMAQQDTIGIGMNDRPKRKINPPRHLKDFI